MGFVPWLQSRYAGVNAAVLFIALLFFGWLWGVAGGLLGAPLIAIAKVICDRLEAFSLRANCWAAERRAAPALTRRPLPVSFSLRRRRRGAGPRRAPALRPAPLQHPAPA